MLNLRNSPFLWLALLLLFSIWVSSTFFRTITTASGIILLISFGLCSVLTVLRYKPDLQYLSTLAIAGLIMTGACWRVHDFQKEIFTGDPINGSVYMEGLVRVKQLLKNKPGLISLRCSSVSLRSVKDSVYYQDKNIVLNIRDAESMHFLPGDMIGVRGFVSSLKGPLNPHAFDARQYYLTLGVRHILTCKSKDVQTSYPPVFTVMRIPAKWQYALSSIVRDNTRPQVAQLTNALVWGDRSDMDEEVINAFADTGAMHVLSVSGMHVAIIYSMLYLILGPPGSGLLLNRILRFAAYAMAILLYVFLAGACPAVVRAGLMILLFVFGKAMGWNTMIWNLLGFAAFVMIWLNPFIWQNVGFQLSFLALAGILMFAKPFIRCFAFRHLVIHKLWEITALSVTAQVFILPILFSKFHQFPLTFILSSFVAIPAAYIVMAAAMINVILSVIGIDFLWFLVDWPGHWFILCMKWMSAFNPLMHYSLPEISAHAMMLCAVLFTLSLAWKWNQARIAAHLLSLGVVVSLFIHRHHQWRSEELVIYHSYKGLLIDMFADGRCITIADPKLTEKNIGFATRGNRCEMDIISSKQLSTDRYFKRGPIFYDGRMLMWNQYSIGLFSRNNIPDDDVSHLIFLPGANLSLLAGWISCHSNATIILPAHVDRKTKKKIFQMLAGHHHMIYDMDVNGFFRIKK